MQSSTEQLITAAPSHSPLPKSAAAVRLHITPFNPSLYSSLLPAPLQALVDRAGGPSYHSVETFPERGFGYIELPAGDAQRLRQKLHGSTLKGMKLRVEAARPKRKAVGDDTGLADDSKERREKKKAKLSRRNEDGVLRGVELPQGRVVKRGWAEKATSKEDKKKQRKATSSEEREKEKKKKPKKAKEVDTGQMIFRTKLPANVASQAAEDDHVRQKRKKAKSSGKVPTEVKEFDKTSKFPTFLRDSQVEKSKKRGVREFVEGKGWIDGEGNVVEEVKIARKPKVASEVQKRPTRGQSKAAKEKSKEHKKHEKNQDSSESEESSVVSSDSDESSSEASSSNASEAVKPSAEEPLASPTTPAKEVHPLEALFKRPASRDKKPESLAPIKTSFSFFESETNDNEDTEMQDGNGSFLRMPQTPFTRRDLEDRGMRSAAPTPDTAAIGKRFRMPSVGHEKRSFEQDDDDDEPASEVDAGDDDDDKDQDMAEADSTAPLADLQTEDAASGDVAEEQTDFEKHFWAHRGDLNRAWKQRKREARKDRRQAENRRGGGAGLRGKG